MNFVFISASNVERARESSASTRACELLADAVRGEYPDAEINILRLLDYHLTPCSMCGGCIKTERCHDTAFNKIYAALKAADGIFMVCPHYAPFPSKVMILLEKLQEIVFLKSTLDENYKFPLAGKPAGVVAHGGMTEEALPYYEKSLLTPLAQSMASVGLKIQPASEEQKRGVVFGIQSLTLPPGERFVKIEHDWGTIEARLRPLAHAVAAAAAAGG